MNTSLFSATKSKYFQGLGGKHQPIKARSLLFAAHRKCFQGLGGKHQPIKARSLLFAAHGKCFQVSMAHKPAGASSFSFKVSTAYKQASTSSFFLKGFAAIADFPRVLGCIDGTHVAHKVGKKDKSNYLNRKGYTSVNVQAICNASNVATQLTVKWPGSTHDSFMWRNCNLYEQFFAGTALDGWLLGEPQFGVGHLQHRSSAIVFSAFKEMVAGVDLLAASLAVGISVPPHVVPAHRDDSTVGPGTVDDGRCPALFLARLRPTGFRSIQQA
ncbi:putative nuclease HARBI1 [Ixodes scapularis]